MKTTATVSAIVATLFMTGTAFAQDVAPKLHKMGPMQMDANNDGKVSYEEFSEGRLVQGLKSRDTNGDGSISKQEFIDDRLEEARQKMAKRLSLRFAELDRDNDGAISAVEIEFQKRQQFSKMDRNDDGVIEGRELRRVGRMVRHMRTPEPSPKPQ